MIDNGDLTSILARSYEEVARKLLPWNLAFTLPCRVSSAKQTLPTSARHHVPAVRKFLNDVVWALTAAAAAKRGPHRMYSLHGC